MFGSLFSKKQPVEAPDNSPSTRAPARFGKSRDEIIDQVIDRNITKAPLSNGSVMDFATTDLGVSSWGESLSNTHLDYFGSHGFIGFQACAILSQHWLIDLACTVPVEDAIRKGWKITKNDGEELDPKVLAAIRSKDKKMQIVNRLKDFGVFGRKYGLRVAIFNVESDQKDFFEHPFNIDGVKKGSYKGIIMNDPYYCTPEIGASGTNPNSASFYEPEYWLIGGKRYHKSHCIIFRHSEVAQILRPSYIYGSVSLTQQIFESVYNAEVSATEVPQLLQNMRLFVMHMDLSQALLNPELMDEKLGQLANVRNNYGVQAIGEEESLEQIQTSMVGLDELVAGRYKLVASVAQMPVAKIMKTDLTGGLVKDGGEESIYHETLESLQTKLEPFLDRHYQLLIKSETGQEIDIDVVWEKLDAMTEKEAADVQAVKAQTDQAYVMMGALSGEDVRERLICGMDSGYNGLELGDLPELDEIPSRTQSSDIKDSIEEQAHKAATSPFNKISLPSQEQHHAGNYKKGHCCVAGIDIAIENPEHSIRSGNGWEQQMRDHYGYVKKTEGADGDHVDVFLKPGISEDFNGDVFIINQINPETGEFDEHKAMIGYGSEEESKHHYLRNYQVGWSGLKSISIMSMDEFKDWLKNGDTKSEVMDRSVSQKQEDLMRAAASNPEFAKKVGIPQSVAQEFSAADDLDNVFDAQGDHWITIGGGESAETGEKTGRHVKLDGEGHIIAGMGGKFTGEKIGEIGKKDQKKQPERMTEEQYLSKNKAGRGDIGEAATHRSSNRISKKTWGKIVEREAKRSNDVINRREELRKEYAEKVASGEIIKPSMLEERIATARGNEDNEAVQAARRLLEKRGIEWREKPKDQPEQNESASEKINEIGNNHKKTSNSLIKEGEKNKISSEVNQTTEGEKMKVISKYTIEDGTDEKGYAVYKDIKKEIEIPYRVKATAENIKPGDVLVRPGFNHETGDFTGFITIRVKTVYPNSNVFRSDDDHDVSLENFYLSKQNEAEDQKDFDKKSLAGMGRDDYKGLEEHLNKKDV